MRFIQHKAEARWFYRVVSLGYDRWINPLFWTAPMRDRALALARLDDPGLEVVDVGAGTGFATEAIVRTVAPECVTMLDQSPHQLARARRKRPLAGVAKVLGDAEALPFATDSRDRYVSTGSIEYWPDPQRAIAEAYRVLRPAGSRCLRARCGARTRWPARCRTPGCSSPARTSTSRGSHARALMP
jgi:MPBQ/MSBQ methyltransferase